MGRGVAAVVVALLATAATASPAWADVPDAPPTPAVAAGNSQITVQFGPANDNGNPVTGYTATCSDGMTPIAMSGPGSPIVVGGLTNGTSYTCTVDATNSDGTSAESTASAPVIPATVPDAPPAPTAVAGDSQQITVTFSPPANDEGRTITGYTATCSGGTSPVSMSGPTSPIVVPNLAKGTTYTCTVSATNAIGTGAASPPSASVTVPATAPSTPARPTLERGNKKLEVVFTPPASNGSPITSYTATCSGGFVPAVKSGSSSPIVVTGLVNGTSYKCKLTATNAVGTSPASHVSLPVIPAAVPDPPARPSITRGIGKIVVKFAKAANNGSAITSYTATCTSSNGGVRGAHAGAGSPITVTGLTNGKIYTCFVTATSKIGSSPHSASSASVIPGTAPAPPIIVSVVSGTAPGPTGPLLVTFKAGANNGTPISSYRTTCTPLAGGVVRTITSTGSPIKVPGLLTAKPYSCRLVAISASGTSGSSGALTATVGTPGIPTILGIAPRSHGLVLSFLAPSNNGDLILHYHARCKSTNGGVAVSQFSRGSPFVVNGLTPGGRYTCTLTAVNGRGEGPASTSGAVRVPF